MYHGALEEKPIPLLLEHRFHWEQKSVRVTVELPFGHHWNGCSVKTGNGVRGGVEFAPQHLREHVGDHSIIVNNENPISSAPFSTALVQDP